MDLYHQWCDLKPGVRDMDLVEACHTFLRALKQQGKIADYRITRRKLGFGPANLGEFHILIETDGLAQLDEAFNLVATRAGKVESQHHGLNSLVTNVTSLLERDFPDDVRQTGEEKF